MTNVSKKENSMSSILTRRRALFGSAALSVTAGLSSLLLPGDALACHDYKGPSGSGCAAYKRDSAASTTSSSSSKTSTQQSSPPATSSNSREPSVSGRTIRVSNGSQLQSALASAAPGNQIELANGTYSGRFRIANSGNRNNPILITASNRLRADLRGTLEVRGDYVIVSGLSFNGGAGVELRAANCRVTRCYFNGSSTAISIRGAANAEVDHNEITRWGAEGIDFDPLFERRQGTNPRIYRNYLYNGLDRNRNAAINLGQQSGHHGIKVNGLVEYNLIENANRQYKTIYCKSSSNTVRYNTIINAQGMENRHGRDNKYIGNWLENCNAFIVSDENCVVEGNKLVKVVHGIRVMAGTISSQQVPSQGGGVPFSHRCQLIQNDVDTRLQIGSVYSDWRGGRILPALDTVVRGHKGQISLQTERNTRVLSTDQSGAGRAAVRLRPNQVGPNSA